MYRGEITLTSAEFALFFEGADFEKRFISQSGKRDLIDSPLEIKKTYFSSEQLQTIPT